MKADGMAVCDRCDSTMHDVLEEYPEKGRLLLVCLWCNLREWVDYKPQAQSLFRLKYGRHAGKTLAEIEREPNGRKYLEYMARTNPSLKDVITEYLAAPQA